MQLLTKELLKRFKKIGRQEDNPDPVVIARYFWPYGSGTWYATEYDPETKIFFGYVSIFANYCDEWGYFSLEELEQPKSCKMIINNITYKTLGKIERDLHFREKTISQALKEDKFSGRIH